MIREAERIAKGIYDGTISEGILDPEMTKLVAEELRKAVINGFGKDLPEVDFNTPDRAMLEALERNTYQFSAAKTEAQKKSMTLALRDENGVIRTFEQFREEAIKISGEYLGTWLRTEYDTALTCAQMAAKWVEIQANKKLFPLLQYSTAGDERVRKSHEALDAIIRPVDDYFWDTFYPPNGWNCRCDVLQLRSGKITENASLPSDDEIPAMFRTNLAKQGLIAPPDHPYWRNANPEVLSEALLLMPQESQWHILKSFDNGGIARIHWQVNKKQSDYHVLESIAIDKAMEGSKVDILPILLPNDRGRKELFKGALKGKNPDLRIDNVFVEVETPKLPLSKNKIGNNIRRGSAQANDIILFLKGKINIGQLYKISKGRFKTHRELNSIEYRFLDRSVKFTREQFKKK